jgi:hypothetical protein
MKYMGKERKLKELSKIDNDRGRYLGRIMKERQKRLRGFGGTARAKNRELVHIHHSVLKKIM